TSHAYFEVDAAKLMSARQWITLRPHTRFAAFPMHTHNYVEIMYMLTGQTTHAMGDGEHLVLRAGELLLFNQHASHAVERADWDDLAVNLIVLPPFFDVALEMIGTDNPIGRFLLDALRNGRQSMPYLHFCVADIAPIQCVLESMVYCLLEPALATRRINQTAMGLLFLHLLNHTEALGSGARGREPHILVMEALREVQDRYAQADFTALAARCGVSLAYLSRLVRRETGSTCTALLQQRRMQRARQLLKTTDLTVAEIGEAVGYRNISYFHRLCKRLMGVSPAQLRAQVK
ncbi:MAG: AraC family transcriptional regulator, partial [Clostridia bacterium]